MCKATKTIITSGTFRVYVCLYMPYALICSTLTPVCSPASTCSFLDDQIIGEGEFGIVRMVHDVSSPDQHQPLACKILRKGVVFKDNTVYAPIKPEVLRGEVEILQELNGQRFCLNLVAVYESPKTIFCVTEYCGGGDLMQYLSQLETDLRTEDVSRISFQLLSAVDHCAKHNVIHRDIKPENVMMTDPTPKAELRLIDFGSGTWDGKAAANKSASNPETTTTSTNGTSDNSDELVWHTTFAGSAFYISPELFQRTYTQRTDVWSAGVTLYVLVAGYPADKLQNAFNILQKSASRDLKKLPNMPLDMPESYYEMLEAAMTFRHKQRPSAAELLKYEFVQFHCELEKDAIGSHCCNRLVRYGSSPGQCFATNRVVQLGGFAGATHFVFGIQKV
jgi:serine/threonine protein kinase